MRMCKLYTLFQIDFDGGKRGRLVQGRLSVCYWSCIARIAESITPISYLDAGLLYLIKLYTILCIETSTARFQVWLVYRILTLKLHEFPKLGFLGPMLAINGLIINGNLFVSIFYFQKQDEHALEHHPNDLTTPGMIALMIEQFVLPFCYLHYFTAFTCWLDILERYMDLGIFSLGRVNPMEEEGASHQRPRLCSVWKIAKK